VTPTPVSTRRGDRRWSEMAQHDRLATLFGEGVFFAYPASPLAALPVRESFARDGRVLARCRASFGRSVRGVAAEVWARPISQRFAGAGAHELCDVLVVTAFSATDHRAQRDPERKTGRDGCRDEDGQDLQKRRHGHCLRIAGCSGPARGGSSP
jgi:hypothetical protein